MDRIRMLVIVLAASMAGCNLYWPDATSKHTDRSSGIPDAGYSDDGGYIGDAYVEDSGCHDRDGGYPPDGGYLPDGGYDNPDGGYLPDGGYEVDADYLPDAK